MRCTSILTLATAAAIAVLPAVATPTQLYDRDFESGELVRRFRPGGRSGHGGQPPVIVTSPSQERVDIIHVPPPRPRSYVEARDDFEPELVRRFRPGGRSGHGGQPPVIVTSPSQERVDIIHVPPPRPRSYVEARDSEEDELVARFLPGWVANRWRRPRQPAVIVTSPSQEHVSVVHVPRPPTPPPQRRAYEARSEMETIMRRGKSQSIIDLTRAPSYASRGRAVGEAPPAPVQHKRKKYLTMMDLTRNH